MRKITRCIYLCAVFTASSLGLLSCKDDTSSGIDGYSNSDQVGSANLIAHWTFDVDNKEVISGTDPSNTYGTVGSVQGQLGNALQLTSGALVYPPINKLSSANALNNFTLSLWVNVKNNKGLTPSGLMSFFSLIPTTVADVWPDITLAAETGQYTPTSDTLKLRALFNTHLLAGGTSLQENTAQFNSDPEDDTHPNGQTGAFVKDAGKWTHYAIKLDATAGKLYIFANGVSVGGYNTFVTNPGIMTMATPVKPVFGSLAANDIGFTSAPARSTNVLATAYIDDVRVFNTILSDKDILALFNLGTTGK